jgi:hypothetical protein
VPILPPLKHDTPVADAWSVSPSKQRLLLECLEAASRQVADPNGWVSARAVARRLSPTADPTSIAGDLAVLECVGFVEMWFKGGHTYYRVAR